MNFASVCLSVIEKVLQHRVCCVPAHRYSAAIPDVVNIIRCRPPYSCYNCHLWVKLISQDCLLHICPQVRRVYAGRKKRQVLYVAKRKKIIRVHMCDSILARVILLSEFDIREAWQSKTNLTRPFWVGTECDSRQSSIVLYSRIAVPVYICVTL